MSTKTAPAPGSSEHQTVESPSSGQRSSAEIHGDIRDTRAEMDRTLDQLGDRLHPRHLLDDLIGWVRSSDGAPSGEQVAESCRRAGQRTVRTLRDHPGPALLGGAAIAWWLFDLYTEDDGDEPEFDGSPDPVEWSQETAAWHDDYLWEAEQDERSWRGRAEETLADLKSRLQETSTSARDKLKLAAGKILSLSGHRQKEIHARWAALREHSGSFVDARTGQPYSESYGREWKNLVACDVISTADEDEASFSDEHATGTVQKLKGILSNASASTRETVRRSADALGEYGRNSVATARRWGAGAGGTAAQWGQSARDKASAAGRAGGRAARSVGRGTRRGAARAGQQLSHGFRATRDSLAETMDESPLAMGAASFGLGLLGGLLLPHTRYEDDLMGDASDEAIDRAKATGKEAYRRGRKVAAATASAAMEEAERQGLAPQQISESARSTVAESRDAVRERAPDAQQTAADVRERVESVAREAASTARRKAQEESEQMKP